MSAASPKSFLLSARTLWGRRTHRLLGLAAFPKDPYESCLMTFRRKRIRRKIPDWPDKALGDCQTTEEFRPWTIRRIQPLRLSRRRSQQTCGLTRQGLPLFAESQHLAWPEQLAVLASRPTPTRLAPQGKRITQKLRDDSPVDLQEILHKRRKTLGRAAGAKPAVEPCSVAPDSDRGGLSW